MSEMKLGMVDRLAKAIFDARPHRHPAGDTPDWFIQPSPVRNVFRGDARAALEALREPTEEMLEATFEFSAWAGDDRLRDAGFRAWQAAIDAALQEKEG